MGIKQGSTPLHTFTLPFETELLKSFKLTYSQNGRIILEKYLKDFKTDGNVLTIKLTQEETFLFDEDSDVHLQARALTLGGDAIPSNIIIVPVEACLDREVLA